MFNSLVLTITITCRFICQMNSKLGVIGKRKNIDPKRLNYIIANCFELRLLLLHLFLPKKREKTNYLHLEVTITTNYFNVTI